MFSGVTGVIIRSKTGTIITLIGTLLVLGFTPTSLVIGAERLQGVGGSSSQWASGWIDLARPIDIVKGERLRLAVGGNATRIVVRLLSRGQSRDGSDGVLGGPIEVPKSRIIEVTVPENRSQIIQISVHGGSNPWGKFAMPPGNGGATLESVERLGPHRT